MDRILTQHNWTPNQRKWLERLANQLVHEVIIDREFVNHRFADDGGAKQMDKVLGAQLDTVLEELNEAMWPQRIAYPGGPAQAPGHSPEEPGHRQGCVRAAPVSPGHRGSDE